MTAIYFLLVAAAAAAVARANMDKTPPKSIAHAALAH